MNEFKGITDRPLIIVASIFFVFIVYQGATVGFMGVEFFINIAFVIGIFYWTSKIYDKKKEVKK